MASILLALVLAPIIYVFAHWFGYTLANYHSGWATRGWRLKDLLPERWQRRG